MNIKEDQQVWSVSFLTKKRIESDLNEELAQDLHKPVIIIEGNSMRGLKMIFGQQIQLKWNH